MLSIYVMHNKTLCIKKSYLKRCFGLPNEISNDFVIIKKGVHSTTALLEYKSLPKLIKRMIWEHFGTPENQTYIGNNYPKIHYIQMDIMNKEIRRLIKKIDNLKTSHGII